MSTVCVCVLLLPSAGQGWPPQCGPRPLDGESLRLGSTPMTAVPGQAMGSPSGCARVLYGIACPWGSQVIHQWRSGGSALATVYQRFLRTR